MAVKVAIEFCLNISATGFLFDQMFKLFQKLNLRSHFILSLEPFILSGLFRNEFIPEDILREFLQCFNSSKAEGDEVEVRNLEKIVQQLDLKRYSVDMKAQLEIQCEAHCLVSGLLALQKSQVPSDKSESSILNTIFKLFKKVG
jgi:hypothetical protein